MSLPDSVVLLREKFGTAVPIAKPKAGVHPAQPLERGWLLDYLLPLDQTMWGRWDYWNELAMAEWPGMEKRLPERGIPPISFLQSIHEGGGNNTRKMLEASLEAVAPSWGGWSSAEYIHYFLDWLLFGFGHNAEAPKEPSGCEGASDRLYQVFNLGLWLLWPYDYLGELFAEMNIGKAAAFFPTPHHVVGMMVDMSYGDGDSRLMSAMDPCVGTGRMMLYASNHSLCLAGMDINPIMVKATLVNGYLYAPWMVKPLDWVWQLSKAGSMPRGTSDTPGLPAPVETRDTGEDDEPIVPGVKLGRRAKKEVAQGQVVLL